MRIIVLCPEKSKRWKYWIDKNVERELGYWYDDLNIPNQEKFRFRWNAKKKHRQRQMAIFNGLLNVLEKLVKEKTMKPVLFVQDDAIIDYDTLYKLDTKDFPETLCYFGGGIAYNLLKDLHKKNPPIRDIVTFKQGLQKIEKHYRMLGNWGIFIKNYKVAQLILDNISKNGFYLSVIDDMALSKMSIDKYCYYPPIVTVRTNIDTESHYQTKNTDSYKYY
jgi:hypothetical protein